MGKAGVARVDAVNGAQLRRPDVVHLIVVAALVPDAIAVQADVGVRIHKAGVDFQPRGVEHFGVGGGIKVLADGCDLTACQQQVDLAGFAVHGVPHQSAADQYGFCLHFCPPLHGRGVFYTPAEGCPLHGRI